MEEMSKEKNMMNSDWQPKLMTALRVVLAIHVASGFAQAVSAGLFLSGRDAAVGFHGGLSKFTFLGVPLLPSPARDGKDNPFSPISHLPYVFHSCHRSQTASNRSRH